MQVAGALDKIFYAFAYFNADTFELETVEGKDVEYYGQMMALKSQNAKLQIILSVGGWNFFSGTFSRMASTPDSRAKFISSLIAFLQQHGFDGVDLDWCGELGGWVQFLSVFFYA